MSVKARFSSQQQPVKVVQEDGAAYVFICLNEKKKTETYPDMGEGETQKTYYEYDYNEIAGPSAGIPLDNIQAHPENYLDYKYQPEIHDPGTQALKEVRELKNAIERGLVL